MFSAILLLLAGCATYHPQPISPDKTAAAFEARSLADDRLGAFFETNHVAVPNPGDAWDLKQFTLVAFYYQPALAEARAQLLAAPGCKNHGGRTAESFRDRNAGLRQPDSRQPSPWIVPVSFDLPIETAGKRGKRIAEAEHLAEAARWNLVARSGRCAARSVPRCSTFIPRAKPRRCWPGRKQPRATWSACWKASSPQVRCPVTRLRRPGSALATTQLAWQDAVGKFHQARVELAHALGVPTPALDGIRFSFASLTGFPRELTRPEVRRQALLNRADVRGALAEYAACQSALQLEIANQYPDLHLGPGYAWNSGSAGDNQWELGLTLTLPVLNHNEGPVAEAEAKRTQAAAHFLTVQAEAVAEIDSALAGYRAALQQVATAKALLDNSQKQLDSVRARAQAGEVDPLAVANAEVEYATGAQSRLNALVQAQQSLGQLEDAVQSPLTLPPETINAAQNQNEMETH